MDDGREAAGAIPAWEEMVLVGRVARAHGLRGHVVVAPETDFVEARFGVGASVWMRGDRDAVRLRVTDARLSGTRPIVAFEGCTSMTDADALAGQELRVPEAALHALEPGSYYHHQLVGCVVETVGGDQVGTVERIEGGAAGSLLVVRGPRGEVLIPLTTAICVEIAVDARRIRVAPPEGLLELNETRARR